MSSPHTPLPPFDFSRLDECVQRNEEAAKRFAVQVEAFAASADTGLHILLVGGADLQRLQSRLRDELKAVVHYRATGKAAIADFIEEPSDLVVIDSQLKDVSISDLLVALHDEAAADGFASIVVTSDPEDLKLKHPAGTDSALLRPLLITEFMQVVKRLYHLKDTAAVRALVSAPGY